MNQYTWEHLKECSEFENGQTFVTVEDFEKEVVLRQDKIKQLEQELLQVKNEVKFWKEEYVGHSEEMCKCQKELQKTREQLEKKINGETSDGYHTFNELYEHRFVLTKALFNSDKERCLKSKKHSDGTMFDNYFIVGINTKQGWATYHYHISKWDDFECREIDFFPEWDGHTSQDAINRIEQHFKDKQGE